MRITMTKKEFIRKISFSKIKLNTELRKKLVRFYVWSIVLYGSETWALRKLERKYLERMEETKCSEKVTNEQVI